MSGSSKVSRVAQLLLDGKNKRTAGDWKGAEVAWREVLLLEPSNTGARENLQELLLSRKNPFSRPGLSVLKPTRSPFESSSHAKRLDTPLSMVAAIDIPSPQPVLTSWTNIERSLGHQGRSSSLPESPLSPPQQVDAFLKEANEKLELDDYSGALKTLEQLLKIEPENNTGRGLYSHCESVVLSMLESKMGDLDRAPRLRMAPKEIVWLNLDHRSGFVLSRIDGKVTFEDLFMLSGMTRLETARIITSLLKDGIIE